MTLIFSFSTHIGDYKGGRYTKDNETDHVLKLYKISMERAKSLGHKIKFYGCDYSLNYLKDYYDVFANVENVEFEITDDLKIYVHTQEPAGSITFDGDIILHSKLSVDETSDIVFEQKERLQQCHRDILNIFKKYKMDEVFSDFSFDPKLVFNVGILRFKTEDIKNLFIDSYYKVRKYYLTNIEPTEKLITQGIIVSTIICQYYFTNICEKNNTNYNFTKDYKSNKYKHYFGSLKFDKYIFESLNRELDRYML